MADVVITSKDEFLKEVKEYKGIVAVDFWAEWCGPCKMLDPIFVELEGEFKGKVKFVKLNVDDNEDISSEYGVQSIPTVIIFKAGVESNRLIGVHSKSDYVNEFNK